ncbi:MAG: hypothetical protein M0P72_09700 [Metallibacterium scheffleri]|jgi:hypothetical protein|uniref:hypothetical protein n=1 Tax=Metallibacterium scheffleri TaxID=993689 RepID=UPI0026EAFC85|nr:hypothetical protein [Metallibacterium scheffleri]MCK9367404.1 hypothetical protein [Metallibacterium scheffleri]
MNNINPSAFLDSPRGANFWRLCDRALIRRAEAEAIVAAVAREVAQVKADPTDDDIAAALPDRVADDDDEHAALRRTLALERMARHAVRLGAIYTPAEIAAQAAAAQWSDMAFWVEIEIVRQQALCALRDRLAAAGLDVHDVLAAGEQHGMVPRDD